MKTTKALIESGTSGIYFGDSLDRKGRIVTDFEKCEQKRGKVLVGEKINGKYDCSPIVKIITEDRSLN
jgi:hypothetical protein